MQGLRTLVYAEKKLSEQECAAFLEQYNEASSLMEGRDEEVPDLPSSQTSGFCC